MKIVNLILCLFVLSFSSCDKEDKLLDSCIKDALERHEMELYVDQEIGCQMTLLLYKYKGDHYFMLDNFCADMAAFPTDCDGNELCRELGEEDTVRCQDFYDNAELVKRIGIAL